MGIISAQGLINSSFFKDFHEIGILIGIGSNIIVDGHLLLVFKIGLYGFVLTGETCKKGNYKA